MSNFTSFGISNSKSGHFHGFMDAEAHVGPEHRWVRWIPRRKAMLVRAVREGRMTLAEVCRAYDLSEEEFVGWANAFDRLGLKGLRVTVPARA